MKPEISESLFIEELFKNSRKKITDTSDLVNIDQLTGDASTRRYYRAQTQEQSYVICLDHPTDTDNKFVTIQNFLEERDIAVPKIYDKVLKKGYLLEQDLGDKTLLQELSELNKLEDEYKVYKEVIDKLISMHKIEPSKKTEKIISEKFDYEKLKFEINFTLKYFLKIYLGCDDPKVMDHLSDLFGPLCVRLSSQKMVFTHRDFHSRNIMVKDKELFIIDFQDARWGIPQYDLASLLDDCYYELNPKNHTLLKEYYYEQMKECIDQTEEEFKSLYTDMAIQRVFKAIGSFTYIYDKRKDERYLKYIGFAMEKLKHLLYSDQKYNELRKILLGMYYES